MITNCSNHEISETQQLLKIFCHYAAATIEDEGTKDQRFTGFIRLRRPKTPRRITGLLGLNSYVYVSYSNDNEARRDREHKKTFWEYINSCEMGQKTPPTTQTGHTSIQPTVARHTPLRRSNAICRTLHGTEVQRDFKTRLHVYWGPTGTGKSFAANYEATQAGETPYYKERGDWWDGYYGQKYVIIENFDTTIDYYDLLALTDQYPHKVQTKGGYTNFIATDIWITSNKPIPEWFNNEKNTDALLRRLTTYTYMDENGRRDELPTIQLNCNPSIQQVAEDILKQDMEEKINPPEKKRKSNGY